MRKAFTLVELMIVVVIVGLLAAFGVPGFSKTVNKARARDAINNLTIIHSANVVYRSRNGSDCPSSGGCANINNINSMNGSNTLNIVASGGTTYTCTSGTSTCTATGAGGSFTATVNLADPIVQGGASPNPSCASAAGNCP